MRRRRRPPLRHGAPDVLPLSYVVDALDHVARESTVGGSYAGDLAVTAATALVLAAATLRRRTA